MGRPAPTAARSLDALNLTFVVDEGLVHIPGPFQCFRGETLPHLTMAYECWGKLSDAKDNAVLILTGLSPTAHAKSSPHNEARGWWEDMIGPGAPIDTNRYFVLCVNNLGSCFGSTGPGSLNPESGDVYGPDFPELTIEDLAAAARSVVGAFGIERLDAIIGPSMGGMTALAYLAQYPTECRRLMLVSSADRPEARTIAIHSLQREAILNDPNWNGGRYTSDSYPSRGMILARKIGMTSYRAANEWEDRFGIKRLSPRAQEPFGIEFQVESYLENRAHSFAAEFEPNSYLYLSRAMDWFDVSAHGENLIDSLALFDLESVHIIGVTTDTLFPIHQQKTLADAFQKAGHRTRLTVLDSIQGHDAFLVDIDGFGPVFRDFLS